MLATSDYRKNIQENINAVVADGNLIRLLYVEHQIKKLRVFELPIPLSVTFKDAKEFDIQNPIGNFLSQVNANNKIQQITFFNLPPQVQQQLDETVFKNFSL